MIGEMLSAGGSESPVFPDDGVIPPLDGGERCQI